MATSWHKAQVWAILLTIAVPACGHRLSDSEWYDQQWLMLTRGPSVRFAAVETRRTYSAYGGPFDERCYYGPFEVIRGWGKAIVLDQRGQPAWAGTWVLPARVGGKVGALLLLRTGYWWDLRDMGLPFEVDRLSFGDGPPRLEPVFTHSYVKFDWDQRTNCPWVVDIDADGTDELFGADEWTDMRLDAVRHRCLVRLEVFDQQPLPDRTGSRGLTVGLDCRAFEVELIANSELRNVSLYVNRECVRRELVGTIRRDPQTKCFTLDTTLTGKAVYVLPQPG